MTDTKTLFDVTGRVSYAGERMAKSSARPGDVTRSEAVVDLGAAQVEGQIHGAMTLNVLAGSLGLRNGQAVRVIVQTIEEAPTARPAKPEGVRTAAAREKA